MKTVLPLAALVFLAACGGNDVDEAETIEPVTVEEPAFTLTEEAAAMVGNYEMTDLDGEVFTMSLNDNGTYSQQSGTEAFAQGDWRTQGNQLCLTPSGRAETCYTGGEIGADGSFRMEGPSQGTGYTVRKVAS